MRTELIKTRLSDLLQPEFIEITDNSHAHAGHAGAQNGGGHFHVKIVAEQFTGKSMIQRHQLIYSALAELMKKEIHALGIEALTPSEISTRN